MVHFVQPVRLDLVNLDCLLVRENLRVPDYLDFLVFQIHPYLLGIRLILDHLLAQDYH